MSHAIETLSAQNVEETAYARRIKSRSVTCQVSYTARER